MSLADQPPRRKLCCACRVPRTATSLLPVLLVIAGLTACGGSSKPARSATASAAPQTPAATTPATSSTAAVATPTAQQRAPIIAILRCMRRHGFHLPEPDASGQVSLRGINVKSHRYQTVGVACFKNPGK